LSQAMDGLISAGGPASHPSSWSPFIVVGGSAPAVRAAPAASFVPAPVQAKATAGARDRAKAAEPARKDRKARTSTAPVPAEDWKRRALGD
jgi:hypothetical protein